MNQVMSEIQNSVARSLEMEEVIDMLSSQITEERQGRIEEVLQYRTTQVQPTLEHIYDQGNVSAVMRSAEAFGFYRFHVINQPNGYFKESHRVTQGAEKWLDIHQPEDHHKAIDQFQSQGIKIYSTDLESSKSIEKIDFSQPCAVVLGNEKDGITPIMREASDETFMIPMLGFTQSFNISVAASLCFYHIYLWRKHHLGDSAFLSPKEALSLKLQYIISTIGSLERAKKILFHQLDNPQQPVPSLQFN